MVINDGNPALVPANRDRLQFGSEVAAVFEQMALRSIPMYAEMHRIHAHMAAEHVRRGRRNKHTIVDVGASTGMFFKTMAAVMGGHWSPHDVRCIAVDTSKPMLDRLASKLYWVETREMSASEIHDKLGPEIHGGADIICLHYLLQFLPKSFKEPTIRAAYKLLRKNGLLLLGQKEAIPESTHKMVDDELQNLYTQYRLENGYTQAGIDASTKSLKGAMWCSSGQSLRNLLYRVGFDRITETTRWCQFSSMVCVKT